MTTCPVCGCPTSHTELTSEVFEINGRRVLIERIPAQVCDRCGEASYSRETTEQVRKLAQSGARPVRTEELEVFALQ